MIIDRPRDTGRLRQLWQQAFGDPEEFLDAFFRTGFSPDRCRCVYEDDALAAMLYWFDCLFDGQRIAYLYAVATDRSYQKKGCCRALMEDTHRHLRALGYAGCVLVPRSQALFAMYGKLGYTTCGYVSEFVCNAGEAILLRPVNAEEYAALRRQYLPQKGVVQEGAALALLMTYSGFYAGENCLAAAYPENGKLTVCELLGDPAASAGLVAALGYPEGKVRIPGKDTPFAMYRPLTQSAGIPAYFGLALD